MLGVIRLIQNINPNFHLIVQTITYSPFIALATTMLLFYLKPKYNMILRRRNIDQNIHHATAFLYAMSKSGLQPIDALEHLSKHKHIYGLIAEEFGIAVRRVRYLGESLNTALKYVANTTSSKKLKEFIYSFITATEQSTSISAFFKTKFEEYFEKEKRERTTLNENISTFGEIAVVTVAVAPTLVLATGVSMGVLNPEIVSMCNLYLTAFLPLSAILFILYVRAILPQHKLTSVTKVVTTLPAMENIEVQANQQKVVKRLDRRDRLILFLHALQSPTTMLFLYPWFYPLIATTTFTIYLAYLYLNGTATTKIAIYGLLAGCLIVAIPHEIRTHYVLSIERRIPDFLRGLSETVERESSIIRAIDLILKSRLELLGREMRRIYSTKLGVTLKQALLMVEYRTASILLKRVVSLLIISSESTRNMKDILLMAAEDAETYTKLRRDRVASLLGQLVAIYVCFIVYVYVYYTLKNRFITSFTTMPGFTVTAFSTIMVQGYYASFILAFFLGLIIGIIVEGSITSGLKHFFIMAIIAIAFLGWGT
ncbi:MAG: type II secretion system F family protein [Candidatus Bathyarchaeota archaeon]